MVSNEAWGGGKLVIGIRYAFASSLHRWWVYTNVASHLYWLFPNMVPRYCASPLEESASEPTRIINYDTPLQLAVGAIKCFRSSQLSGPSTANTLPLEAQYQKEFYRCLFTALESAVIVSPELFVKGGTGDRAIGFFVALKKWGN